MSIGADLERRDGALKVAGQAPYAYEHEVDRPAYLHAVTATIARGRVVSIDPTAAHGIPGVLAVLTHENAPRLASTDDAELAVLQGPEVGYRGQFVAAVVAETPEDAREGARLVRVEYDTRGHDVHFTTDRDDFYAPEQVNAGHETDQVQGDPDALLPGCAVVVEAEYETPWLSQAPMEPHTTVAHWNGRSLTVHDSTQSVHGVRQTLAGVFGLDPERVRVVGPYVGGGFGSKGNPHAHEVLACLGAQAVPGRSVKFAVTRQQTFSVTSYREPTISRLRLGADADGRLRVLTHDAFGQTARIKEFAEQTATAARMMYSADARRTTHRMVALDVPVPSWMRAPGECPGMFALECAVDELATACGVDPVELRILNDPPTDPENGLPWSNRRLVDCLREGSERFGWARRDPLPRRRLQDGWWVGTGVASSVYPAMSMPGNQARIAAEEGGRFRVSIGASDIGQGAWTVLAQIAAEALGIDVQAVDLEIGDSSLPVATVAGGSSGTSSWGAAISGAADAFRAEHGLTPPVGATTTAAAAENPRATQVSPYSFGAQFAEVHVHADTGELRVPRMLGVFSAGRIINPRTARSQFLGAMTMGLSMALFEDCVVDERFGHVVTQDLANYHVAANADIADLQAFWLEETDPNVNPMGSRGVGEIGIVGAAAAIANAAWHATGVRVRSTPLTADAFLAPPA